MREKLGGTLVRELSRNLAPLTQIDFSGGKILLLRVIVADNIEPALVVTVYRTSQIAKY